MSLRAQVALNRCARPHIASTMTGVVETGLQTADGDSDNTYDTLGTRSHAVRNVQFAVSLTDEYRRLSAD